jgi:ribonucleotide reductase alpha subunit
MIKTIIKRNGSREQFNAAKLNGWGEWAARKLGHLVDWPAVVLHAVSTLPEDCTSEQLQNALIDFCLAKKTWEYNLMAGRLYAALMSKQIHGRKKPSIKDLQTALFNDGLMAQLNYSDEEYEQIEKMINHNLDLKSSHYELQQIRYKYALRNKVTGKEYETPQFTYMRMAMALAENEPKENRMTDVAKWYEHLSHKRINAPTPYYTNLGTTHNGYASCCVYTTGDTAPSLAAGDHIAYMMTVMSAGIGSHIKTRSLGDPVRGGLIKHQGKIPYYRALVGAIGANLQNGRGGAATVHYTAYDPEVEVIAKLKNAMTPAAKQVRGCDYSFGSNKFFAKMAAQDKEIATFSYHDAPELYEAQYDGDSTKFERLYEEFLASEKKRTVFSARKILISALEEAYETGRHYLHFTDTINKHTPFKEKIYSSNLCLAGNTLVKAKIDGFEREVTLEVLDDAFWAGASIEVMSMNDSTKIREYKKVVASKLMRRSAEVLSIKDELFSNEIVCTGDHKVYTVNRGYVEAKDLLPSDALNVNGEISFGVIKTELQDRIDVYDITVEDNHNFYANNILVHNCQEIALVTKPFKSVQQLYEDYTEDSGEIALCNIAAIVVSNIENDAQYDEVAYYTLKMIDVGIHKSTYVFKALEQTAKARLNAGVGMMGVAHLMAKNGKKYSSQEGKNFMHELAETHAWHVINASLKLAKEKGNAPWMHKTKWPEGWLPIDTYEKKVDSLVTVENKRDWESLRKEIIANGGIRNSVCIAFMPGESSSLSSGTTNGLYPIRDFDLVKTSDTMAVNYVVPDATKLRDKYEIAWDVPTTDLIHHYAIVQKWTDQAISADLYRKIQGDDTVGTTEMMEIYFNLVRYGIKTRYYQNSLTAKGIDLNSSETNDDAQVIINDSDDEANCEGCSL